MYIASHAQKHLNLQNEIGLYFSERKRSSTGSDRSIGTYSLGCASNVTVG
jgi:hypothetical protein